MKVSSKRIKEIYNIREGWLNLAKKIELSVGKFKHLVKEFKRGNRSYSQKRNGWAKLRLVISLLKNILIVFQFWTNSRGVLD